MHPVSMSRAAQEAFARLKEGNERFTRGLRSVDSLIRSVQLGTLAERGQSPFCIVLTCSDSRIPVEILFDCGPGDIFVVRVAGNVVTPALLGSIEFAAEKFGTPLCVVMGHTLCGAVQAALGVEDLRKQVASPNIRRLLREVLPSAAEARRLHGGDPKACLEEATQLNVRHSIVKLQQKSRIIKSLTEENKLTIVGAICDLRNGKVDFESPELTLRFDEVGNA